VWLVALPLLSAASVAWWRMGELAEPFGSDKNYSLPFAEDNATRIGVRAQCWDVSSSPNCFGPDLNSVNSASSSQQCRSA